MSEKLRLVQKSLLGPRRVAETIDGDKVQLQFSGLFWKRTLIYSFDEIDPTPIHERSLAWGWALGSAFFLLVSGVMLWDAFSKNWAFEPLFSAGFMGLIAAALVANTAKLSTNVYAYRSSRAHVVLFSIRRNNPSKEAVDSFVASLAKLIGAYRTPQGLTPDQLSEHFQKVLDYLIENEIITPDEARPAINRIEAKRAQKVVLEMVKK